MLEESPSESNNHRSMSQIGFNSMHAASNRGNPMRDLSKMILGASSKTPDRNDEVHTASGDRKSTFAAVGNSGTKLETSSMVEVNLDVEMKQIMNRSPERTRPTSEERKINRPTTKHFFTVDNQERKR